MRTSILSLFSSSPSSSSLISTPLLTRNLHRRNQYDNEEELIWTEKIDEECSINNDEEDEDEYTYCDIVDCDNDDENSPIATTTTTNNYNGDDNNFIPVFTSKRTNPKDTEPSKLSSISSTDTNEPKSLVQWCWGDDGIIQRWYPPFHVTAVYLWTQFNVSFILQFFQFLFQPNNTNDSNTATTSSAVSASSTNDENYDTSSRHIATIHYYETGISDIIVMNLIVLLFLTTAWMYRSKQYKLSTNHNTETTTSATATPPCFLPELITAMTFMALIMRLRITAINILVVSTIYMFVRIVFWTYRSLTW